MSAWWRKSTNGAGHSSSPPLFALLEPRPEPPALTTLKDWLASWSGIGAIIAGMTRQGFNVEVRQFPEGWRANFYPAGLAHSIVRHGVGADAVGGSPAGGVDSAEDPAVSAVRARLGARTPISKWRASMDTWEYFLHPSDMPQAGVSIRDVQTFMNARGAEGWELVGVYPNAANSGWLMFFKRPARSAKTAFDRSPSTHTPKGPGAGTPAELAPAAPRSGVAIHRASVTPRQITPNRHALRRLSDATGPAGEGGCRRTEAGRGVTRRLRALPPGWGPSG